MNRPTIDMARPTTLYLASTAMLLLTTFVLPRLPLPSITALLGVPQARAIAGGTLFVAIFMGLLGAQRLAARAQAPWRVPQSQSAIAFIGFFIFSVIGLALSI